MTITEFLEARIAEDEAAATLESEAYYERMVAECAAKRAIASLHSPTPWERYGKPIQICAECGDWWDGSPVDYPCNTIKIFAAAYADHPDFDPEWVL